MNCSYCDGSVNVNHVDAEGLKYCSECYNALRDEKIQEMRDYIDDNFGADMPGRFESKEFNITEDTFRQLYVDDYGMGDFEDIQDFADRMEADSRADLAADDYRDWHGMV